MKMLFRFILLSFVTSTATAASATIVTKVIDVTKFGALGDVFAIETKWVLETDRENTGQAGSLESARRLWIQHSTSLDGFHRKQVEADHRKHVVVLRRLIGGDDETNI